MAGGVRYGGALIMHIRPRSYLLKNSNPISHATQRRAGSPLRCGESSVKIIHCFITNLLLDLPVKEFLKSVNIYQNYRPYKTAQYKILMLMLTVSGFPDHDVCVDI